MPQFGHIIIAEVTPGMARDVVIGALATRHRASHLWDNNPLHSVRNIDPGESLNMSFLVAFEWTQVAPQSC